MTELELSLWQNDLLKQAQTLAMLWGVDVKGAVKRALEEALEQEQGDAPVKDKMNDWW